MNLPPYLSSVAMSFSSLMVVFTANLIKYIPFSKIKDINIPDKVDNQIYIDDITKITKLNCINYFKEYDILMDTSSDSHFDI